MPAVGVRFHAGDYYLIEPFLREFDKEKEIAEWRDEPFILRSIDYEILMPDEEGKTTIVFYSDDETDMKFFVEDWIPMLKKLISDFEVIEL